MSRLGAAAWTGDIHSTWSVLKRTPAALLNWSLAGEPYSACDIGGFRGEDTPEMLTRWMQAGTFFPVMRTHSSLYSKPHFPWLFGDEAEAAIRKTLELRYRLIPILYSLAHQTQETGEPIMRPLLMQYPSDPELADLSDEWLVGRDLLAAPVLDDGSTTAYLSGKMRKTQFTWDDQHRTLSWTQSGSYDGADRFRTLRITINDGSNWQELLNATDQTRTAVYHSGSSIGCELEHYTRLRRKRCDSPLSGCQARYTVASHGSGQPNDAR